MRSARLWLFVVMAVLVSGLATLAPRRVDPVVSASTVASPANVSASFLAGGTVDVSWSALSAATGGYRVGWSDQNGALPVQTVAVAVGVTAAVFTPPAGCAVSGCRVWVASVDGLGQGPWSAPRFVVGRAPSAPRQVAVSAVGVVSWLPPADLGLPALNVYEVEVTYWNYFLSPPQWVKATYGSTSTSLGLSAQATPPMCRSLNDHGCSVRVFAGRNSVLGVPSERVYWSGGWEVPGAPTNVVVAGSTVSWDPPVNLGYPVLAGYSLDVIFWSNTLNAWMTRRRARSAIR